MDWDYNDEKKMLYSFDKGREDLFSHFVDVKFQAEKLGYYNVGVSSLAKLIWDYKPPKSKKVGLHTPPPPFPPQPVSFCRVQSFVILIVIIE